MTEILAATATVGTVVTSVFTMITDNPLLTFLVAVGLIGTGVGVFKKIKGASKGT